LQLVNLLQNKTSRAIEFGEKSLSIARELNLREQMAYVLSDLGWAYVAGGQFAEALERMEEAALLWEDLGNLPMLSNNLNVALFGNFWAGRDEKVLSVAEQAYQISSSIKEVWNQASARSFQGQVWFDHGEIDKSILALEESVQIAAQGHNIYEIWYRAMLCRVYGDLGAADIGMDLYQAHRIANKDVPHTPMRTATLVSYALFEIATDQLDTAAATLAGCEPDAPSFESMFRLAKCRLALAQADYSAASAVADSAIELARTYKLGRYLPEALFLKGKCHFMQNDLEAAKVVLEQARIEAEKLGSRRLLWQIIATLAELEPDKGRSEALMAAARPIVEYIADHITRKDLREFFLRTTAVSVVSA
jgi:tetratricopeptide (TPR) repeat protein